jgi:hypothetical protein
MRKTLSDPSGSTQANVSAQIKKCTINEDLHKMHDSIECSKMHSFYSCKEIRDEYFSSSEIDHGRKDKRYYIIKYNKLDFNML